MKKIVFDEYLLNQDDFLNFKNYLLMFINNFKSCKKYLMIYTIFILVSSLTLLTEKNLSNIALNVISILFVLLVGIFLINYYFINQNNDNLHKTAFYIILIFGILCIFLMPICEPSDAHEHLARAEITSRGILFPEYNGENYTNYYYNGTDYKWTGEGFEVISSIKEISYNRYKTVFETDLANNKIDHNLIIVDQAFEQNPFYGYIPQAIGIILAKLLNLNEIWLLWLARLGNLLFYAGVVSLAIKKSPILKMPLLFTACLPIAMFQAFSVSIDAMIISLSIYLISYFFYMVRAEDNSISLKEISIFMALSLLLGLLKLPYLVFIFLIFAIPKKKFIDDKTLLYSICGIIIIGFLGFLWSNYATEALWHSYRATHYLKFNVNSTQQLEFLLSDVKNPILLVSSRLNRIDVLVQGTFLIYPPNGGGGYVSPSGFISSVITLIMGVVYLVYPSDFKISKRTRSITLIVLILLYFGICLIQFLSWSPVGKFTDPGVIPRYFLPLFILVPFIVNIYSERMKKDVFDNYLIIFSISLMALMVLSFVFGFY